MFLDTLIRRNPGLLTSAITLHQQGQIPANSYVLDLDQIAANARVLRAEADRLGLFVLPMTKQVARNPAFLDVLAEEDLGNFVVVDIQGARQIAAAEHRIGHVGHLVQVPRRDARWVARTQPQFWTVLSHTKAMEAAEATANHGRTQDMLLRVYSDNDTFYPGHEGGVLLEDLVDAARAVDALPGARFTGITTWPALLFDHDTRQVKPTPHLPIVEQARALLTDAGWTDPQINAPGTTSTQVLSTLAEAGATQVEPGHGLTGTTPLHAVEDLPELPAVCYVSEVSHHHEGTAYCFGGGLYIDPVFPDYQVQALIGRDGDALETRTNVTMPPPNAIDYYAPLDATDAEVGESVVFGFRIQAFVTRANIVPVRGISTDKPTVMGIWSSHGVPQE